MKEIFGRPGTTSFARYDPATSSLKTSQVSLLTGTSDEFSATFPRAGTMLNGQLSELTTLVLPTAENASGSGPNSEGLWPSPVADGEMWPTATTGDAKAHGSANYSTASGRHSGTTLTDAVVRGLAAPKFWATPNAHPRTFTPRKVDHGIQLANQVQEAQNEGQLNPVFVEWLMGYPPNYTLHGHHTTLDHDPHQWPHEWPDTPRVARNIPHRIARLRCLGNAVVPQVVQWIAQRMT